MNLVNSSTGHFSNEPHLGDVLRSALDPNHVSSVMVGYLQVRSMRTGTVMLDHLLKKPWSLMNSAQSSTRQPVGRTLAKP